MKKAFLMITVLFLTVSLNARNKSSLSLFNRGLECQQERDYFSAVDFFTEALQKNEGYGEAWFHLAQCTYELGEYDLALDYVEKAEKFSSSSSEIKNLRGFTYIALGNLKEAREIFESILKSYPNDVDSRFGLAQINLFEGSFSSAQDYYEAALKRQTSNKKALLSLALLAAEQNKFKESEKYIEQALVYHNGDYLTHYLAAYLSLKQGNLTEAEKKARSSVQLNTGYDKAYEILAVILYRQKRYAEVIDICDYRINRNHYASDAWYLKGLSLQMQEKFEEAIDAYSSGLAITPGDEIMRSAMELLIQNYIDVEDSRRNAWCEYHLNKALEYKRNFDSTGERYEYQQALKLNPLSSKVRQLFAELLYREGFYELYLSQLQFINANEYESSPVPVQTDENKPVKQKSLQQKKNEDVIEALNSMLTNTLSNKWNVNPFYLDKTRWNISLFYQLSSVQLLHPDAESITSLTAKEIFSGIPSTSVNVEAKPVSSFGEAYRLSRGKSDYFVILKINETERSISFDADIYSSRTGTLTKNLHVYRTGNDRYANALRRFRQAVLEILPIRGKVLAHTGSTLLVDLGKSDGITKDAEFEVIQKGNIYTVDKGTGIAWKENSNIGKFKLEILNEEISEGKYTRNGFYDVLNDGDEIVLIKLPETTDKKDLDGNAVTDTRPAADSKGEPATDSAVNSERKDLKLQNEFKNRESVLINLIRGIQ